MNFSPPPSLGPGVPPHPSAEALDTALRWGRHAGERNGAAAVHGDDQHPGDAGHAGRPRATRELDVARGRRWVEDDVNGWNEGEGSGGTDEVELGEIW